VVQDDSANAGEFFPIIHTLFSNIKAWLVGTHLGVSAKHLPPSTAASMRRWLNDVFFQRSVGCSNRALGR
jgi:hypothetical protein